MLIAEDDTVPEVWYLLGLALHGGGEFDDALNAAGEAERLVSQRRHEDPDAGETLLDIEDLKVSMLFRTLQHRLKDSIAGLLQIEGACIESKGLFPDLALEAPSHCFSARDAAWLTGR